MIVACPHCSTGYLLPEDLMGPGGARVRCPRCRQPFTVEPGGTARGEPGASPTAADPRRSGTTHPSPEPAVEAAPARPPASEPPSPPAPSDALVAARAALDDLVAREGEALGKAAEEQRLFSTYGPALMEAYESFRRRVGGRSDPGPFREAVRERWGVDLLPLGRPQG